MEIVKCTPQYYEALRSLERECFPSDYWEEAVWEDIQSEPDRNITYLALDRGIPAAFLMVYNWGSEKNYVKITNIGTRAPYRGRGLARTLMETMLTEMQSEGMTAFAGETRVSNRSMQRVFESFGFCSTETLPGYYEEPDEDGIRYWLDSACR